MAQLHSGVSACVMCHDSGAQRANAGMWVLVFFVGDMGELWLFLVALFVSLEQLLWGHPSACQPLCLNCNVFIAFCECTTHPPRLPTSTVP